MTVFVYRCPKTGQQVQGWTPVEFRSPYMSSQIEMLGTHVAAAILLAPTSVSHHRLSDASRRSEPRHWSAPASFPDRCRRQLAKAEKIVPSTNLALTDRPEVHNGG